MIFQEALQHLMEGSIITPNDFTFFLIEGNNIWRHYIADKRVYMRQLAQFDSYLVLRAEWKVLTIEEENVIGVRG